MNFIFYDTETTGTDTTFDQILQFAAILTGPDFKEIDRFNIRCRIMAHIIPSPGALLATNVTPTMLDDANLQSHYEMMRTVASKLRAWSPAIFIGYNNLAFDEPLLRQALYQTLQPIYLTNTNGNKRADVIRLVHAASALVPNAIAIPISESQRPTFKLDRLAPANGYTHENAHDALADVEATIFMAKLVQDKAPRIWQALMPMIDKQEASSRILSTKPHCLVEYQAGRPVFRPIIGCGQSTENSALLGVFDLTRDPSELMKLDTDGLLRAMSGPDRAIRIVQSNKMPIIVDLELVPDDTLSISSSLAEGRARRIASDSGLRERINQALTNRYPPREQSVVVERRLYERFPGKADEQRMAAFQKATWGERARIADEFDDDRIRELGSRLVFLEAPFELDPQRRLQFSKWLENRRSGRENSNTGRTIKDAIDELAKFDGGLTDRQKIECIREWIMSKA